MTQAEEGLEKFERELRAHVSSLTGFRGYQLLLLLETPPLSLHLTMYHSLHSTGFTFTEMAGGVHYISICCYKPHISHISEGY